MLTLRVAVPGGPPGCLLQKLGNLGCTRYKLRRIGDRRRLILEDEFAVSLRLTGHVDKPLEVWLQTTRCHLTSYTASRCLVFVPRKCVKHSVTLGPPWVKCILHACSNISLFPGTFMHLATFLFLNPFLFHITKCRILDSNMGRLEPHALPR